MGEQHKLVTRKCACGCTATFKCLPESPQKYISKLHEVEMMTMEERMRANNTYISTNPKNGRKSFNQ